jgi:hypothetical protein
MGNCNAVSLSSEPQRFPRECGGPVNDKFLAEVNSYTDHVIDLFEGLFVHWIPAYARKTLGEGCFAQRTGYNA